MNSICRKSPIEALTPIGIAESLFSYFSPRDITCRIALVCRDFAKHSADERIWQGQAVRQLDKKTAGEWFILMGRNWKKTCFVRRRVSPQMTEIGIFKQLRETRQTPLQIDHGKTLTQPMLKVEVKLNGLGQRIHSNGMIEQGVFIEGDLAQGVIAYPNGIVHDGKFLGRYLHGLGIKTFNGNLIEKGQFWRGLLHGQGNCILPDGRIAKGEFKGGLLHGRGMIIWPNKMKEQGIFCKGRLTAKRQIILPNGTRVEATIWINGVLHGPGTVTYPNGTVKHVKFHSCYVTA